MTNPQQNAPSPNRKVAEEIVNKAGIGAEHFPTTVNLITLALDQKDQEAREKVARVVRAVESCGVSVWTSGEADELTKARCKGHEEMAKVKEKAARSAAANEMREGEE